MRSFGRLIVRNGYLMRVWDGRLEGGDLHVGEIVGEVPDWCSPVTEEESCQLLTGRPRPRPEDCRGCPCCREGGS